MSRLDHAFTINQNKGFGLTFENGWTISVQFGPGNYGSNHDADFRAFEKEGAKSDTAEIAAWDPDGTWWDWDRGQLCASDAEVSADADKEEPEFLMSTSVKGYCSISEVVGAINLIANMPMVVKEEAHALAAVPED
jgi:hypothetical protein